MPAEACFVGSYQGTYVWVMSDGIDGLSRFTLTVMQSATRQPDVPTRTVRRTYDRDGQLDSMETITSEPEPSAPTKWRADFAPVSAVEPESARPSTITAEPRTPHQTALTPKQARKRRGTSVSLFPQVN